MYYRDLSPYEYRPSERGRGILNVGWLDAEHDFPKGETSDEFRAGLMKLCHTPVNQTRGFHLSPFADEQQQRQGCWVRTPGGMRRLGSAEIRVEGPGGKVYAAPDMVLHYVTDARYLPPPEFVCAVCEWYRKSSGATPKEGKTQARTVLADAALRSPHV